MIIAATCAGSTLEDALDRRFGRAPHILFVDTDTLVCTDYPNEAVSASGGAGIATAQFVIDKKADAVLTGQLGPKAYDVLHMAGIPAYAAESGSVRAAVEAFSAQKLPQIGKSGPSHVGKGH